MRDMAPLTGYRGPERRQDHARRRAVAAMTRAELVRELLTDPLTGLPNRRAYEEDEAPERATSRPPIRTYVYLDLAGLKWLNDNHGHDAGDAAIAAAGNAIVFLRAVSEMIGHVVQVYRMGGDEFAVRSAADPEALRPHLHAALKVLRRARAPIMEGGRQVGYLSGLVLRWGVGPSLEAADRDLIRGAGERGREPDGLMVVRVVAGQERLDPVA